MLGWDGETSVTMCVTRCQHVSDLFQPAWSILQQAAYEPGLQYALNFS